MNLASLGFIAAFLALAALIFHLPRGRARQFLLAACNIAFLCTWIPNAVSWGVLAVFLLSGYLIAAGAAKAPRDTRSTIVGVYIAALIAAFVVIKKYQFLALFTPATLLGHAISIIGLSYMLFRQIHFIVDVAEEQIVRPTLWDYLNYQLDLFGLLAGPIQRFQMFRDCWDSTEPIVSDRTDILLSFARIFIGVIKVALLGTIFLALANHASMRQLHARHPRDLLYFAALFYCYPAYIYFNFAGYCDIAIAGARLVGMRLPENFNHPYLARNMIDFWTRWHMTLTNWIRDYVFNPLYKRSVELWPAQSRYLAFACYFVALFLAGIWHGSTWNFVAFGLLHGGGVSAAKVWEDIIIQRRGRKGLRAYLSSPVIRGVAIFCTFNFVCFTFLFFPPGLRSRVTFLHRFISERPAATAPLVSSDRP